MTVFKRIAGWFHSAERFFARLHRWRWKHARREMEVEVTFKERDGEWVARTAHRPGEHPTVAQSSSDSYKQCTMTLREATAVHDAGICDHCFWRSTYRPQPH